MLRRRLAVLLAAAMMVALVGVFSVPALADNPPNAHNCVASETSTGTPQYVNHNQEGSFISGVATGELAHGELGAVQSQVSRDVANCGATGSQAHP